MIRYRRDLNLKIKRIGYKPGDATYEEDIPSKNILLIGNGFDLRAGIESTFKDFIFYVIYGCALHNLNTDRLFSDIQMSNYVKIDCSYPSQLKILLHSKDLNVYKKCSEFADNIFGRMIFDHLFNSKSFCNLILYFGSFIDSRPFSKEQLDSIKSIYGLSSFCRFNDLKIPKNELNKGIGTLIDIVERERDNLKDNFNVESWLDIESVIEMLVTGSEELKLKYGFEQEGAVKWNASTSNEFLNGLELFELLLTLYLRETQKIDIKAENANAFFDSLRDAHIHSLTKRSHGRIQDFNLSNPNVIINYNYTNIAERFYRALERNPEIIHINGSLDVPDEIRLSELDTNIVIGYTNTNRCQVSKDAFPFEKQARRVIKNTEYVNINNLIDSGMFDLIIVGHSCGIADSDVIGRLLSSENLKTAVILCHSYLDLVLAFNNIKAMLTEERFNELLSFSEKEIYGNLYFSVENKA